MTKRNNSRAIETPFGTFYGGVFEALKDSPSFYAETESGEVTVNGVTYSGTVYCERGNWPGAGYYLSCRHLTRWDDKRGHFYPPSDSAQGKLSAALLPTFEAWASDAEYVRTAKARALRSSLYYALHEANRAVDKANDIASQLRDLGVDVDDVPRFDNDRDGE